MQIELAEGNAWRVSCPRPDEVTTVAEVLATTVSTFGMPIVVVEAERPSMQRDRSAASATQSSLDAIGLRTIDGQAARANRRPLADTAVAQGMSEGPARAAIDQIEGDFIARIESGASTPIVEPVYGVNVARAELALSLTVLHGLRESVVRSLTVSARRQSRSPSTAQRDVEASAANDAAVSIAGTIASEWLAIGRDQRPWLVEVLQPDADVADDVMEPGLRNATVLEYRPGVRALFEMPGSQVTDAIAAGALGRVLQRRPGFLRVQALGGRRDWTLASIIIGAAIVSGTGALLLVRVRTRSRHSSIGSL